MTGPVRIREIIEFETVDAHDEDEVTSGWVEEFNNAANLPIQLTALGKPVTLHAFDGDPRRGMRCEVEGENVAKRWVGVDSLDQDSLPPTIREVLDAYDAWSVGGY